MTTILAVWKKKPEWNSLPHRFQKILKNEFGFMCHGKRKEKYPGFCETVESKNFSGATKAYFNSLYQARKTIAGANREDQGFQWNEMSGKTLADFQSAWAKTIVREETQGFSDFDVYYGSEDDEDAED
jgi:hypothetical protein